MWRFGGWLLAIELFWSPSVGSSAVEIPQHCRVPNKSADRCGWCAVETLARYHQIDPLHGLAERNASRASAGDLQAALDEAGVDYRLQDAGNRDTFILRYAIRENLGAIVGFAERSRGAGGHIVTLVDYGPGGVQIIDSNDDDGRVRTMSLERFLSWWDGFVLVIDPQEEE